MENRSMKWIALVLFGSVGLVSLVAGGIWAFNRYQLYSGGLRTQGKVVEHYASTSTGRDDDGVVRTRTSYYPVVEYQSRDGRSRRFRGSTGSSVASYEIGAEVNVLYMENDPGQAQIADFEQFWLGPLAVSLLGVLFMAGGIGGFFLISGSDRAFGPQFQQEIERVRLEIGKEGIRLAGRVVEVRKSGDDYVIVCQANLPNAVEVLRFEAAPIVFDPGPFVVGKAIDIFVDPHDRSRYAVVIDPLLADIQGRR